MFVPRKNDMFYMHIYVYINECLFKMKVYIHMFSLLSFLLCMYMFSL